jgi:type III restriction enzyme
MSKSGFQFDSKQQYQLDAIQSVVDLFDGQPKDVQKLKTSLKTANPSGNDENLRLEMDYSEEIGAIGNNLVLDHEVILANLQRVQDRNGLEVIPKLFDSTLDFDIEMETGTGKTYVYLRTMFELARS